MTYPVCYVVLWIVDEKEAFTLWVDGERKSTHDSFLVNHKSLKLLASSTIKGAKKIAHELNFRVKNQEPQVIDISKLKTSLSRLRPDKYISANMAKTFLNAWNAFDDLAFSVEEQFESACHEDKDKCGKLYNKIFYGNNLPSVTPDGHFYNPILSENERRYLKFLLGVEGISILRKSL